MYCALCKERIFHGELLMDSDGWEWSWDIQVCKTCSPKRYLTSVELEALLGIEITGEDE